MPKPGQSTYFGPNGIDYKRSGYKFQPGDLIRLAEPDESDNYEALIVGVAKADRRSGDDRHIVYIEHDTILIVVAYAKPAFKDGLADHVVYHAIVNDRKVWVDDIWFKKYEGPANANET